MYSLPLLEILGRVYKRLLCVYRWAWATYCMDDTGLVDVTPGMYVHKQPVLVCDFWVHPTACSRFRAPRELARGSLSPWVWSATRFR